jgi:hypothetical protein
VERAGIIGARHSLEPNLAYSTLLWLAHQPINTRYLYHAECIDPWLLSNGNCPTCKHEFVSGQRQGGAGVDGVAPNGGGGDSGGDGGDSDASEGSTSSDDSLDGLDGDDVSLLGRGNNSDNVYDDDETSLAMLSASDSDSTTGHSDSETVA